MKDAMAEVWSAFDSDVELYLSQHYKSVDEVFRNVLGLIRASGRSTAVFFFFIFFYIFVLMPVIANSDRNLQAVLNSLTSTLINRQNLLLYDIENILEDFEAEMFTIQTDSLSPIRTSIVGQIMAETYRKAKMEYGMFSCAILSLSLSLSKVSISFI
jgi:hypothetical protein